MHFCCQLLIISFSAITVAAGEHLSEISDATRLGGLSYGTWMVLAVIAITMITVVVCGVRKLTKVGTLTSKNIFCKKKDNCFNLCW